MSKDLEFQPSFENPNLEQKKCGWRLHTDLVFLARIVFHACVYSPVTNCIFHITHCLCEIDQLFRSIENTNSFSFFCTLKFELINVVGDTFSFIAFSIEHYAYVKC